MPLACENIDYSFSKCNRTHAIWPNLRKRRALTGAAVSIGLPFANDMIRHERRDRIVKLRDPASFSAAWVLMTSITLLASLVPASNLLSMRDLGAYASNNMAGARVSSWRFSRYRGRLVSPETLEERCSSILL